jgi:hypothetical protein
MRRNRRPDQVRPFLPFGLPNRFDDAITALSLDLILCTEARARREFQDDVQPAFPWPGIGLFDVPL